MKRTIVASNVSVDKLLLDRIFLNRFERFVDLVIFLSSFDWAKNHGEGNCPVDDACTPPHVNATPVDVVNHVYVVTRVEHVSTAVQPLPDSNVQ